MKRLGMIVAGALLCFGGGEAGAGAWTRAGGEVFISQSVRYFSTEFSASRDVEFARSALGVYAEYGVTDMFTAVAEVEQGFRLDGSGFGSQDGRAGLFVRAGVWRGQAGDVAALQLGGTIPYGGFTSAAAPGGDEAREIRAQALYGRGFISAYGSGWVDAALGFAKFTSTRADEIKLDLTLGFRPAENWLGIVQVFGTRSLRNAGFGGVDYDLLKVQLSVGRVLFGGKTLLIGFADDVAVRGASPGYELSVALWSAF
ncbi:MAG: hypothetical protein WD969_06990 [Paracoccaceae bacterium]